MGEPFLLLAQLGLLTGLGIGPLDLTEPEPELVGLLDALPGPGGQLGQLFRDLPVPFVRLLVGAQRLDQLLARVTVEGGTLAAGLQQPLLVHLAVHGHQVLGQIGERADGDGAPAQPGTAASLDGDGPRDDQLAVLDLAAHVLHLLCDPSHRVDDQCALDGGPLRAGTDPGGVGPPSEQQPQTGHHHGLARARLARDHGESRR